MGQRGVSILMTAVALALLIGSCAPSEQPVTQVVVAVNADSQIAARVKSVEVRLYPAGAIDENMPARVQAFALVPGDAVVVHAIPLSFGITQQRAESFAMVVRACADGPACADVLVEQKQLVRFQKDVSLQVDVLLTSPCERAASRCAGLQTTCAPLSTDVVTAGTCVPVREVGGTVIRPGEVRFPVLPEPVQADAGGSDSTTTSTIDAGMNALEDAAAFPNAADASELVAEAAAPVARTCPLDHSCSPDYPCEPDQGTGYLCRGQFADWPMPDTLPGAKEPARYEVVAAGEVVRDLVTGLEWQQREPDSYDGCSGSVVRKGDTCSWAEAKAYCGQLRLLGSRWRVPSKVELESLLDLRGAIATLDTNTFFVTPFQNHWTASSLPWAEEEQAYVVNFMLGAVTAMEKVTPYYVRCVRSPEQPLKAEPTRYVDMEVELLMADRRTGLSWLHPSYSYCTATLGLDEASAYCADLAQGFRLPSMKELLTLVDPTERRPAIVEAFKATTPEAGWYWSTTKSRDGTENYVVGSQIGGVALRSAAALRDDEASYCVRCVQ